MIQIEPDAFAALQQLHQQLTVPCEGLRLEASGNSCQGVRIGMMWTAIQYPDDIQLNIQGLRVLADRLQWPYLDQCRISLSVQHDVPGFSIQPQPMQCQCSEGSCTVAQ